MLPVGSMMRYKHAYARYECGSTTPVLYWICAEEVSVTAYRHIFSAVREDSEGDLDSQMRCLCPLSNAHHLSEKTATSAGRHQQPEPSVMGKDDAQGMDVCIREIM